MCQAVTTDVDIMKTQAIEILKDEYQVEKVPNRWLRKDFWI